MHQLVQLVNAYALFSEKHPEAGLEDFCRYFLVHEREGATRALMADGIVPPNINAQMMKLMGRITLIVGIYGRIALQETRLKNMEGFGFLNVLQHAGEMRKSDVINHLLIELSTGTDILNRLIWEGLAAERPDPGDKRSKLVSITPKGQEVLNECYPQMHKVGHIMFSDLAEDDKKLIVQLLTPVEVKHSKAAVENKSKGIDEIMRQVVKRS